MQVMIARKKQKKTQAQICEEAGICRTKLSKIENGEDRTVTKDEMIRLAKTLNATVEELFFKEI